MSKALGRRQTVSAIRQTRTSDRVCESYVWLGALAPSAADRRENGDDRLSVHQGRGRRGLPRGGVRPRTERRMALSIGFIFMARRDDGTVRGARAYVEAALALGVVNLGFKDVGLPRSALRELARAIRAGGGRSFLEVVSLDRDS